MMDTERDVREAMELLEQMDDEKNQSANYTFFERKLASISIPLILNQLPSLLHIIGRNFG